MGLLDDAIKEHLDLKRRRGADPAEVERAEREALGPVRRGPEEPLVADPAEPHLVAYDDEPGVYEEADDGWDELTHQHEQAIAGTPDGHDVSEDGLDEDEVRAAGLYEGDLEEYESPATAARSDVSSPADSTTATPGPAEQPAPQALRFTSEQEHEYGDAPPPHVVPPHPADIVRPDESERPGDGETAEYDVERALDGDGDDKSGDDDVLEETPEFLQDTPDHDRLWFEQKPPRDFDFDG